MRDLNAPLRIACMYDLQLIQSLLEIRGMTLPGDFFCAFLQASAGGGEVPQCERY